jgi:hypothetical protein
LQKFEIFEFSKTDLWPKMGCGRPKFGRKVWLSLKNAPAKFFDPISKIDENKPKKHTPSQKKTAIFCFFWGGG